MPKWNPKRYRNGQEKGVQTDRQTISYLNCRDEDFRINCLSFVDLLDAATAERKSSMVSIEEAQRFAKENDMVFKATSALTQDGVKDCFDATVSNFIVSIHFFIS